MNNFYGLAFTIHGILESATKLIYKFFVGNIVELAGLPTILSSLIFSKDIEFIPQWSLIIAGMLAVPASLLISCCAFFEIIKSISFNKYLKFLTVCIVPYIVFNFFWNANDAIFWIQILPIVWTIYLYFLNRNSQIHQIIDSRPKLKYHMNFVNSKLLLPTIIVILAYSNIQTIVTPVTNKDFYTNQLLHNRLLSNFQVEIIPGWDNQKWMLLNDESPPVKRYILMNMALKTSNGKSALEDLPEIINSHLNNKDRILIARLYDLDKDLMPWNALQKLGWQRSKIKELLESFCIINVGTIDSITFYEIEQCISQNSKH
ncbi:hypothetical protein DPPLL_19720 [Desulfofustis limnaeus]|uniref:Uncharacterized protein n=1 Tax=Desulfofustis limnaeus TaxID=2740163 RepID=A0ABN6M3W3_9BACT|nr:hypothetical protein DPPLL_19720 [Desulfofustis limnaeus]